MTRYEIPAEPPAAGWDIHCHTAFSDGTMTPEGMVAQAVRIGLEGVAITDHDTSAGWGDAVEAAQRLGLPLLRGTEITAADGDVSVHMLGLQYDPTNERLVNMFATTRRKRLQRTRTMVELMARDFPITWQMVERQVREGERTTVGRPHIADALVAAGVYRNRSEAFPLTEIVAVWPYLPGYESPVTVVVPFVTKSPASNDQPRPWFAIVNVLSFTLFTSKKSV